MSLLSRLRTRTLGWWYDVPLPACEADAIPIFQSWYRFDPSSSKWVSFDSKSSTADMRHYPGQDGKADQGSRLILVTWNVDATSPAPEARISALISHIQNLATSVDIIFLQEVSQSALQALLEIPWLREHWYSSEADTINWGRQSFASMTFVSRSWFSGSDSAALGSIWRVDYPSRFERDALCCDILLPSSCGSTKSFSHIRLINVHLDSLPIHPSLRPRQLSIIASYLRAAGHGLVAGDFNPVLPEDDMLVNMNWLLDVWSELHPSEDGFTWGVDRDQSFPPNRLDKVAMTGLKAYDIQIIPPGETEQASVSRLKQGKEDQKHDHYSSLKWSDHSGLMCSFAL